MKKEIFDLFDMNRQKLSEIHVRGDILPDNTYHQVIHICYINDSDQLLIQRRDLAKDGWPGLWDISIGGAVQSGETPQMAAIRESKEELGIDFDFSNMMPQFTKNFRRGFDDYFIIRKNIELNQLKFSDHEVMDAKWASLTEIYKLIDEKKFIPIHEKSLLAFIFDQVK